MDYSEIVKLLDIRYAARVFIVYGSLMMAIVGGRNM